MWTLRSVFTLILATTVTAGCVPGAVVQNPDMEEMKRRLAVVEKATVSSQSEQSLDSRLDAQGKRMADLQAEVDALRVELQRLTGQYEDAVHQREELHDLLTMMRSELELKVSRLEEKLAGQVSAAPPVAVVPVTNAQQEPGADEQYEAALKLIQKENRFADGRKGLQRFLRDHPKHELAVNAIYWIGEAYYGEKQYEKAILQFQDVIQKFPKHAKAPAALLKQGLAFGMLGEKATEKALLQKVTAEYPASPEAKKAKEFLNKK